MLSVLVVEPDTKIAARLRQPIHKATSVELLRRFDAAKKRLAEGPLDFLVTNLRLADFNGLHLVYLAASARNPPRTIVYTDGRDPWLARDVQRAGAFYETLECLPVTLSAYLNGALPSQDRREGFRLDRRSAPRGGRRCWDKYALKSA
jgi:DNA-binding NtrC family response regulator